jgi:hypothetical protein
LSGYGVSRVDRGEGCPYDLVLKSGGPITFDSRSGVSSLAQVGALFLEFFRWIEVSSDDGWFQVQ